MNYKYAPNIKIGDVFVRIDKNGKEWTAEVIDRTDYYVDLKKIMPYKIKIANTDISGDFGCYHYEDAPITYERAIIHEVMKLCPTGRVVPSIWNESGFADEKELRGTGEYFVEIKEPYTKSKKYDKRYYLRRE